MKHHIKSHAVGKLRIYITPADKVKRVNPTTWQKLFPKSAFVHIVKDAKDEGILNASVYATQYGFSNRGNIQSFSIDGDNSKLTMCVELVDERKKLEAFFIKHKDYLNGKMVIYKEVEFWDID
jgi:PII-like signaling protein